MKKYLIGLCAVLLLSACSEKTVLQENEEIPVLEKKEEVVASMRYAPGVSIVKFDETMTEQIESELQEGDQLVTRSAELGSVIRNLGVSSVHRLFPRNEKYEERARREGLHRWYVLEFDKSQSLTKAEEDFAAIPGVEIVESQPIMRPTGFNDPKYSSQWHFYNDGKNGKIEGIDINVEPVWKNYTTGSPKVIVAVIDQGVQLDHQDLSGNTLPGGPEGSINLFTKGYVIDPGDHGCHVAGVISAVNNNGILGCSIAGGDAAKGKQGVRIMSVEMLRDVKVGNKMQSESVAAAPGFQWAADHGAVIAQNSWGYPADQNQDGQISAEELEDAKNFRIPKSLTDAIDYFIKYAGCDNAGNQLPDSPMKGGVVFFAAGNDAIQYGDVCKYEPVIAVGAMDSEGKRSYFSNFGDWVDIAAPGSAIYSCYSKNGFGSMQGTSMACPHASGVAALVLSYRGGMGFTNEQLKDCVLKGANSKMVSSSARIGPMLDALGAVTYGLGDYPAEPVYQVKASSNNADFTWKLTESPKGIVAYSHMLMASRNRSSLEKLTSLHDLPEDVVYVEIVTPEGKQTGQEMTARLTGMDFDTDYFVCMAALGYGRSFDGKKTIQSVHTGKNNPPRIEFEKEEDLKIKSFEYRELKLKIVDPDGHRVSVKTDPVDGFSSLKPVDDQGNYLLTIDGNSFQPGKYELKVHLEDEFGLKVDTSIPFEVFPNRAPEKLKDFEGIFSSGPGEKFEYVLDDYICDPDGEELSVSYEMTDRNVLHINLSEGKLYVTILDYGMTEVSLVAKDSKDQTVVSTFKVLVRKDDVFAEIFPNPVKDVLNIRTGKNEEMTDVEILSGTGATLFKGSGTCSALNPMKIGVSALAPGRYQVKVSYAGKSEVKSIVKR